jgi:segregation and condensation protein B
MDDIMRDASADTGGQPVPERSRTLLDADSRLSDVACDAGADGDTRATVREIAALLRSRGANDMSELDAESSSVGETPREEPAAAPADVVPTEPVPAAQQAPVVESEQVADPVVEAEQVVESEVAPAIEDATAQVVPTDDLAVELPDEGVAAEDAVAAVAAEEDTLEIDESELGEAEDGLPPVPELAGADEVARVVFVLLLSQRDGLSLFRLAQACNVTQKAVEAALEPLAQWLQQMALPVEIVRTGESVKLLSRPDAFPFLQRLRGVKKMEKLSPAALETLAVIAYRQPVMRAEIEGIRGVKAGPMLRTLLQHKLVRITGRADVPGRPLQYGTTDQFLERFGLASLQELPSVKEWKQLG